MKMEAPLTWPNLARLVRQLPARVMRNRRVLKAFKTYGEFTDADVKKVLGAASFPEIRVGELPLHIWGSTPDTGDHCVLNQIMIQQFEQLILLAQSYDESLTEWSLRAHRHREWEALVARAELSMEALILHELVHWGDGHVERHHMADPDKYLHQDGAARQVGFEDRGHQFVGAAYGKRFGWEKNTKTGLLFTDHDLPGWMGTTKRGDVWYIFSPLNRNGLAPIRPPALEQSVNRTSMKLP